MTNEQIKVDAMILALNDLGLLEISFFESYIVEGSEQEIEDLQRRVEIAAEIGATQMAAISTGRGKVLVRGRYGVFPRVLASSIIFS